jgi:hypothetical protein
MKRLNNSIKFLFLGLMSLNTTEVNATGNAGTATAAAPVEFSAGNITKFFQDNKVLFPDLTNWINTVKNASNEVTISLKSYNSDPKEKVTSQIKVPKENNAAALKELEDINKNIQENEKDSPTFSMNRSFYKIKEAIKDPKDSSKTIELEVIENKFNVKQKTFFGGVTTLVLIFFGFGVYNYTKNGCNTQPSIECGN